MVGLGRADLELPAHLHEHGLDVGEVDVEGGAAGGLEVQAVGAQLQRPHAQRLRDAHAPPDEAHAGLVFEGHPLRLEAPGVLHRQRPEVREDVLVGGVDAEVRAPRGGVHAAVQVQAPGLATGPAGHPVAVARIHPQAVPREAGGAGPEEPGQAMGEPPAQAPAGRPRDLRVDGDAADDVGGDGLRVGVPGVRHGRQELHLDGDEAGVGRPAGPLQVPRVLAAEDDGHAEPHREPPDAGAHGPHPARPAAVALGEDQHHPADVDAALDLAHRVLVLHALGERDAAEPRHHPAEDGDPEDLVGADAVRPAQARPAHRRRVEERHVVADQERTTAARHVSPSAGPDPQQWLEHDGDERPGPGPDDRADEPGVPGDARGGHPSR